MRFSLRWCAVPFVVSTSVLMILGGCTTPAPVRETDSGPVEARTAAPAGVPSELEAGDPSDDRSAANELPRSASVFLSEGLSGNPDPVIVGGAVAAGWFHSADDGEAATGLGAMGLYVSSQSLYLAYRVAAAGGDQSTTQLSQLVPRSEIRRVRAFEPVQLRGDAGRPNGFRVLFSGDNRDEEIFVIWTSRPGNPPYTVRLPISAVRRTALRDLTGDETREMVHLSVVFDAMGNREIIADALRWDSARFVHVGSVSLLRAINEQLTGLEARLSTDDDNRWKASANSALQPIEQAPPVGPLLPAQRVRVPRITELSINLERGEWEFFHDIAVEGNLYRLRIHLEANPLAEHPARIDGIQGL